MLGLAGNFHFPSWRPWARGEKINQLGCRRRLAHDPLHQVASCCWLCSTGAIFRGCSKLSGFILRSWLCLTWKKSVIWGCWPIFLSVVIGWYLATRANHNFFWQAVCVNRTSRGVVKRMESNRAKTSCVKNSQIYPYTSVISLINNQLLALRL